MISTQEVAQMLGVAETTVKRWSDEGVIPCVRTPGGHRKFLLKDITAFASLKGYTIVGSQPPPMTPDQRERLEVGVYTKNYARVAEVFREEALQADRDGMLELLLYLHKHQIPFPVIADEVVRPAFDFIGELWQAGKIEVSAEHAASHALADALARMSTEVYRKKPNGMETVCACPEGELHENGLRCAGYGLEFEGWKVHFIGANTPFDTLAAFVDSKKPRLACISAVAPERLKSSGDQWRNLSRFIHGYGGRLLIGGPPFHRNGMKELGFDFVTNSTVAMISYVRDVFEMKPGPKKKAKQ